MYSALKVSLIKSLAVIGEMKRKKRYQGGTKIFFFLDHLKIFSRYRKFYEQKQVSFKHR